MKPMILRTVLVKNIVTIFLLIFFLPLIVWATPQSINFQGKLTDSGGLPVTDSAISMTFRVYDASTNGTLSLGRAPNC